MKLQDIKKVSPEAFVTGLQQGGEGAAKQVLNEARAVGLNLEAYMELAVDPSKSAHANLQTMKDGVAAVYRHIGVPVSLQGSPNASLILAASTDTFSSNKGLAVLIQPLVETLIREKGVRPPVDDVSKYIAQSRQVSRGELITRGEWEGDGEDALRSFRISEGANIPKRTIKATETSTRFYKHGSALEASYETLRDIGVQGLLPFVARQKQEQIVSRAQTALEILQNGDGVFDPVTAQNFSVYNGGAVVTNLSENGLKPLLRLFHQRYKAGRVFDTIVCGYETAFQLALMFPMNKTGTDIVATGINGAAPVGMLNVRLPLGLQFSFELVASPTMAENQLLIFDRSATLEELIRSGSQISEDDVTVGNQMISYYQTINTGYKFIIDESRLLINLAA